MIINIGVLKGIIVHNTTQINKKQSNQKRQQQDKLQPQVIIDDAKQRVDSESHFVYNQKKLAE